MNVERRTIALYGLLLAAVVVALKLDPYALARFEGCTPADIWRIISPLGNGAFLFPLSAFIYILGLRLKGTSLRKTGSDAFVALITSGIAVHLLKAAFERPRMGRASEYMLRVLEHPFLFDTSGRFNSFPSGHSAAAFAFAYAIGRSHPSLRPLLYAAAAVISLSRVFVGSHYPSDIVGGAAVGVFAAWLFTNPTVDVKKRAFASLAFIAIFVSFFKTGGFILFDVDEAIFSAASREMFETLDLITPTYNYAPRFDKPVLIYWLISGAYWLFGVSEFSSRFPSSLGGVMLVLTTFFFVKRVRGARAAYLSSVVLLLNIEFFIYTHSALTDMTLTLLIAASACSVYLAITENDRRWWYAAWGASALAVLTKGVIGLLFPGMTALIYLLLTRDMANLKRAFRPLPVLLFLALALPWFSAVYYVNGREFFDEFIIRHHMQRYAGSMEGHGAPVYSYVGIMLIGFFPWAAFIPSALRRAFGEVRSGGGLYLFTGVWFAFIFVFFSAASTKLPNYIFPLFPASAVMTGLLLDEMIEKGRSGRMAPLYIAAGISIAFTAACFVVPSLGLESEVAYPAWNLYFLGLCFLASAIIFLFVRSTRTAFGLLMAVMVVFLVFIRVKVLPPANAYLQKDLYRYATYARGLGDSAKLVAYEIYQPSLAFYYGGEVRKLEKPDTCDIPEYSKRGTLLVVTSTKRLDELGEYEELTVLDRAENFVLLADDAVLPPVPGGRQP